MNSVADLGGIFMVPGVTARASSVQIINTRDIGLDIDHLSSAVGPGSLFTFSHSLKTFIRDEVVTRFGPSQDSYPG